MIRVPLRLLADDDDPDTYSCLVPVLVDGRRTELLLDSGAARTVVIDPDARPAADQQLVELSLCGHVGDTPVGTVPLEPVGHPGQRGLLGQDVLGRRCCRYALAESWLELDLPELTEGHPIEVGARGHLTMELCWPDGTQARAVFDTGATMTVVDTTFVGAHPSLFRSGADQAPSSTGTLATGHTVDSETLTMLGPSLLGHDFEDCQVASTDLSAIIGPNGDCAMIIGWPLLSQGRFTIDHRHKLAHFEARPGSSRSAIFHDSV